MIFDFGPALGPMYISGTLDCCMVAWVSF